MGTNVYQEYVASESRMRCRRDESALPVEGFQLLIIIISWLLRP